MRKGRPKRVARPQKMFDILVDNNIHLIEFGESYMPSDDEIIDTFEEYKDNNSLSNTTNKEISQAYRFVNTGVRNKRPSKRPSKRKKKTNGEYSKAFAKVAKDYQKKDGSWKKNGFGKAVKAAHNLVKSKKGRMKNGNKKSRKR